MISANVNRVGSVSKRIKTRGVTSNSPDSRLRLIKYQIKTFGNKAEIFFRYEENR